MLSKDTTVLTLFSAVLFFLSVNLHAQPKTLKIWEKNEQLPATFEFIELALSKAEEKYGKYVISTVSADSVDQAFELLNTPEALDVIVSGVEAHRETQAYPIYIPLDRGLLGFRVCLIQNGNSEQFNSLSTAIEFQEHNISIFVNSAWPDNHIYRENGFNVEGFKNVPELTNALSKVGNACFSRSLIEIDSDALRFSELDIEPNIAFIYPLADIVYVNKSNKQLQMALEFGLKKAVSDQSFFRLFNKHYEEVLQKHSFYFRKMFLMRNTDISSEALDAINKYGIASFNKQSKIDD